MSFLKLNNISFLNWEYELTQLATNPKKTIAFQYIDNR